MSAICINCGLPKDLCVCETIAKESQKIMVYVEKKKFGKSYTIVQGINDKDINLKDVCRKLKNTFACGGTAKGGIIELQGDHKSKVKEILVNIGFPTDTIEIR